MSEGVVPNQTSHTTPPKTSIFLIDDCEDMLTLGRLVLEREGYDVFTATGAREAFDHLARAKSPDLILLDWTMTEMGGPALMSGLKERFPTLRDATAFVFYSGLDEEPVHDADGFIRKSGDLSSLIRSVHAFIT